MMKRLADKQGEALSYHTLNVWLEEGTNQSKVEKQVAGMFSEYGCEYQSMTEFKSKKQGELDRQRIISVTVILLVVGCYFFIMQTMERKEMEQMRGQLQLLLQQGVWKRDILWGRTFFHSRGYLWGILCIPLCGLWIGMIAGWGDRLQDVWLWGDFCNPCHSCGVIYAGVRVVLSKRDETMTERMSKEGAMENKILEAKGIKRTYSNGLIDVPALKKCDISIKKGEFVAVIGKSGSGKSTLLHVLAGLDEPDEGEVWIDGKNIVGMKEKEKAVFRRRNTGYVYQDYNLMPEFTFYENVVLPLRIDGKRENRGAAESFYCKGIGCEAGSHFCG